MSFGRNVHCLVTTTQSSQWLCITRRIGLIFTVFGRVQTKDYWIVTDEFILSHGSESRNFQKEIYKQMYDRF